MNIPTKKDWKSYFNFRKKISIDLIVANVIAESSYEDCIKKTKKVIKENWQLMKKIEKAYKRREKTINKKI